MDDLLGGKFLEAATGTNKRGMGTISSKHKGPLSFTCIALPRFCSVLQQAVFDPQ